MSQRSRSLIAVFMFAIACAHTAASPRVVSSFDLDWRFSRQDTASAKLPEFDDSAWQRLDVPHDWSIEEPADAGNPSGGAGGFFPDGVGWYRKHFSLPDADSARKIFIDFDSVMANGDVWINGVALGHRPYGYVPLHYELTGHLNFGDGKNNVLAVRVDQSAQPASRYYMGAGIIGHVHLLEVDPVHFEHNSLFVTTPKIDARQAVVHVQAVVVNQSDSPDRVAMVVNLLDPDGKPATDQPAQTEAQMLAPGKSVEFSKDVLVAKPQLWDLEHPNLYKAMATLIAETTAVDDDAAAFGIRTIKFDPEAGFALNGKKMRIQGVCLHADASCFGTAVPLGAWERRLAALKPFGVNALRTAHNPPSPQFLDLCDRMGFLVMDEMYDCWDVAKNRYDYHLYFDQWSATDLGDVVRRDRNHPSIILYSAGNEIHDTPNAAASIRILTGLVKEFHAADPTRPVTQALLRPNNSHDYTDGLADLLDVVGTNYRMTELLAAQQAKPARLIIGTENHISDIPFLAEHQPLAGIFIWAGVDYLGEARTWPQFASGSGLLDRTNQPKASAYYARATWTQTPFVHVARGASRVGAVPVFAPGAAGDEPTPTTAPAAQPGGRRRRPAAPGVGPGPTADWTPDNLNPHPETVWVYSNCPRVELSLNGAAIPPNADAALPYGTHTFAVQFAPGVLKAVAFDTSGKPAASDELRTAGPASKLVLSADTSTLPHDWDDIACIHAAITDASGITVPVADREISFTITGSGVIAATDSAENRYRAPFTSSQRMSFHGRCDAMVKSNADAGTITVTASAAGLLPASVSLQAVAAR